MLGPAKEIRCANGAPARRHTRRHPRIQRRPGSQGDDGLRAPHDGTGRRSTGCGFAHCQGSLSADTINSGESPAVGIFPYPKVSRTPHGSLPQRGSASRRRRSRPPRAHRRPVRDIDTWSRSVVRHLSPARTGVSASPRRPIALPGPPVRACCQRRCVLPEHL